MCGEAFDDLDAYQSHLAEEHDLHDDDGAESSFGVLEVAAPAAAVSMPSHGLDDPRPRPSGPGDRGKPWGLVALVLLLLVGFTGLVALTSGRDDGDEEVVADVSDGETTTDGGARSRAPSTLSTEAAGDGEGAAAGPSSSTSSDATASPTSTTTGRASGGGGGPGTSPGGSTTTSTTTSTTASTTGSTSTTAPSFVAPTTSGARIDGCQRVKNRLRITYSWQFDGGVGWSVPSGYSAVSGGRHQDLIDVPRNAVSTITSVQVLDGGGRSHTVALQPALSSSSC